MDLCFVKREQNRTSYLSSRGKKVKELAMDITKPLHITDCLHIWAENAQSLLFSLDKVEKFLVLQLIIFSLKTTFSQMQHCKAISILSLFQSHMCRQAKFLSCTNSDIYRENPPCELRSTKSFSFHLYFISKKEFHCHFFFPRTATLWKNLIPG